MNNRNPSCIAIGNFDGIHIGHDALIKRMIDLSNEENQDSVIITFRFVRKDLKKSTNNIKYINSRNIKLELLKSYNVTEVAEIELDEVISKYSPEHFIKEILIDKYNAKNIVVGYNFTFGHKASGNVNTLRELENTYDYKVEEIFPVKYNGVAVSSTLVRSLLNEGKILEANKLLINKFTIYKEELNIDYNKKIAFANNNSTIIIPPDGKYKVVTGGKESLLTINSNKDGSILIFDNIEQNEDIIFLDRVK